MIQESLVFYNAQHSKINKQTNKQTNQQLNPSFELFSQLTITFLLSNQELGFQFLTQTDTSFSRYSNLKPENGHSRFTLKSSLAKDDVQTGIFDSPVIVLQANW